MERAPADRACAPDALRDALDADALTAAMPPTTRALGSSRMEDSHDARASANSLRRSSRLVTLVRDGRQHGALRSRAGA